MALLLVNPVSIVRFAGWESDTFRLGRSGWDISVEESFEDRKFNMLLYHHGSQIKMLAEAREHPMKERYSRLHSHYSQNFGDRDGPMFNVVRAWAGEAFIRLTGFLNFSGWSDTSPTIVHAETERDVMSLPIFTQREAPKAEELIVEPQDVMQLLDQIKRMQSPEQAAIRANNRRTTAPTAHATILSFAA